VSPLPQSPRRPTSPGFDLFESRAAGASDEGLSRGGPSLAALDGFGDGDVVGVDLGRELDLAAERPYAGDSAKRGSVVLVAAIVASSLALAGIFIVVRGDGDDRLPSSPAAAAPSTEATSTEAIEPVPVAPTPAKHAAPSQVATHGVPASGAKRAPLPSSGAITPGAITPAAIATPGSSRRPAPPSPAGRPTTPAEGAWPSAIAPGVHLPAPVFDEPAPVQPQPEPVPVDDTVDSLPGIDEPAPVEPQVEPEAAPIAS
jgi:hypothetical protein